MKKRDIWLFLILFVNIGLVSAQSSLFQDEELRLHMSFDEDSGGLISDLSGNGNDGEVYGATLTAGKVGGAYEFDGIDDFILPHIGNDEDFFLLDKLTFSAWVYPTADGDRQIFSKDRFRRTLQLQGTTDGIYVRGCVTTSNRTGVFCSTSKAGSIKLNEWQHVAMTYDDKGDRTVRLYINGVEADYEVKAVVTGELDFDPDPPSALTIGRRTSGTYNYFRGKIDEPFVFSRALNSDEILELYEIHSNPILDEDFPQPSEPNKTEEVVQEVIGECVEAWVCTMWSECANGIQIRTCEDINECGTNNNRPIETQICKVQEKIIEEEIPVESVETESDECKFKRVEWTDEFGNIIKEARNNQQVFLTVETEGCDGKTVEFTTFETDGIFGKDEREEYKGVILGGKVRIAVLTKWEKDGFGKNAEFVFKAETNPVEDSGVLSVNQVMASPSLMQPPVIFYTDVINGPNTGGENNAGIYISIFGKNFGADRASVNGRVFIGGQEVAVYKQWGVPSRVYDTHGIQMITVQPGVGISGSNLPIVVEVNGIQTQINPDVNFTTRAGTIIYTDWNNGNDANDGSFGNPKKSAQQVFNQNSGGGVVIVLMGGVYNERQTGNPEYFILLENLPIGTNDNPTTFMGYPGHDVFVDMRGIRASIFGTFQAPSDNSGLVISNFRGHTGGTVATRTRTTSYIRLVNNDLQGLSAVGTGVGMIMSLGSYFKVFGNNIHNVGEDKNFHGLYWNEETFNEIGWNHIYNIRGGRGIQTRCPDIICTNLIIHDNVFHDIDRDAIGAAHGSGAGYKIYNNIIYRTGLGTAIPEDASGSNGGSSGIKSGSFLWEAEIYNNVLFDNHANAGAFFIEGATNLTIKNNIIVASLCFRDNTQHSPDDNLGCTDMNGQFFFDRDSDYTPENGCSYPCEIHMSGNIWYTMPGHSRVTSPSGDIDQRVAGVPPMWETNPITADPDFINALLNQWDLTNLVFSDFHLQVGSPAIDVGTDVSGVVKKDFDGVTRPQGTAFDLGVYEGVSDCNIDGCPASTICASYSCNTGTGLCELTPLNQGGSCSDGAFCNGAETCNSGICASSTPIACNDGYSCTMDTCNEAGDSCSYAPNNALCNDNNACTLNDRCVGASGAPVTGCLADFASSGASCDDGYACTINDQCNGAGSCLSGTADNNICLQGFASCTSALCNPSQFPTTGCGNYQPTGCDAGSDFVMHLKFDEGSGTTAFDSSGKGNHGTLINGVTWVPGKIGNGVQFDGVDDYVDIGNSALLNPTNEMTIMFWFKPNSISDQHLVGRQDNVANDGWDVRISNGDIEWQFDDANRVAIPVPGVGQWLHVVGTWDGAELNIYVDGEWQNIRTGVSLYTPTSQNGAIGDRRPNLDLPFNGIIDEVRFYNRSLLDTEISDIYAQEAGGAICTDSDGDSYNIEGGSCGLVDCNDGNININPGAVEICDGIDNNCVNGVDEGCNPVGVVVNTQIGGVTGVDLLANGTKIVIFNFSVSDGNIGGVNDATAFALFSKAGEPQRTDNCALVRTIGNTKTYQCEVGMQFYDAPGIWNVKVNITNSSGQEIVNNTETFTVNTLRDISINPISFGFGSVSSGASNIVSLQNTIVTNRGNYEGDVYVTAYDLRGLTNSAQSIPAGNFRAARVGVNACSSGNNLANGANTAIISSNLPRGISASDSLTYCLVNVPNGISSQVYSTQGAGSQRWVIATN